MINLFYSVLSGLLLVVAYPKFDLAFIAWFGLAPFLIAIEKQKSAKNAICCGVIFGLSYFGGIYFWLNSISQWVGGWAVPTWAALCVYQTLYILVFAYFTFLIFKYSNKTVQLVSIPLLWCFIEWIRAGGQFGVPGSDLGYTQYLNLPIIQIARYGGVYGVSFLLVLCNVLIALLVGGKGKMPGRIINLRNCIAAVSIIIIGVYVWGVDVMNSSGKSPVKNILKIAIIQPDIGQKEKLDPKNIYPMIDTLARLSRRAYKYNPDIIIWPETAVTAYLGSDPDAQKKVFQAARESGSWLLTGAFFSRDSKIFNSLYAVSPGGKIVSRYDKEHLMPFGEYLPFRRYLYPLLRNTGYFEYDESPNGSPALLLAGGTKIGAMICFESLIADLVKERSKGADFLLTVTNDSWFGKSPAAEMHIMSAPFRAVENRKYFVQAANTGISAVVDPYGRFVSRSGLFESKVIVAKLRINSAAR